MLGEEREHRFLDTGSDGRCRVVIEVDLSHSLSLSKVLYLEQAPSARQKWRAAWEKVKKELAFDGVICENASIHIRMIFPAL